MITPTVWLPGMRIAVGIRANAINPRFMCVFVCSGKEGSDAAKRLGEALVAIEKLRSRRRERAENEP